MSVKKDNLLIVSSKGFDFIRMLHVSVLIIYNNNKNSNHKEQEKVRMKISNEKAKTLLPLADVTWLKNFS